MEIHKKSSEKDDNDLSVDLVRVVGYKDRNIKERLRKDTNSSQVLNML